MAVVAELSTSTGVINGGQDTLHAITIGFAAAHYEVQTSEDGGFEVDSEDYFDKDGKRMTTLIYNRNRLLGFDVICLDNATPIADFPEGGFCKLAGLTTFIVKSARSKKAKGAQMLSVSLREDFVSTAIPA